jgi:hypothetical protein
MNGKHIWQQLGMTIEQFRDLLPGGAQDRDGFPGTLVTSEQEKTFKERMRERDKTEGWVRRVS